MMLLIQNIKPPWRGSSVDAKMTSARCAELQNSFFFFSFVPRRSISAVLWTEVTFMIHGMNEHLVCAYKSPVRIRKWLFQVSWQKEVSLKLAKFTKRTLVNLIWGGGGEGGKGKNPFSFPWGLIHKLPMFLNTVFNNKNKLEGLELWWWGPSPAACLWSPAGTCAQPRRHFWLRASAFAPSLGQWELSPGPGVKLWAGREGASLHTRARGTLPSSSARGAGAPPAPGLPSAPSQALDAAHFQFKETDQTSSKARVLRSGVERRYSR